MNPNELDFKTDTTGITYKLREAGIKACQSIYDEEQYAAVKQTLQILAKYAEACQKDRAAEKELILAETKRMHEEAAQYQHKLPGSDEPEEVQEDKTPEGADDAEK